MNFLFEFASLVAINSKFTNLKRQLRKQSFIITGRFLSLVFIMLAVGAVIYYFTLGPK